MLNCFKGILLATLIFSPIHATQKHTKNDRDVIRVLSIDSGGIRGLIALAALVKIEEELGKPAAEIFDFIAGSSTGSIIALGLSIADEHGQPKYSAREIFNAYEQNSKSIFDRRFKQKLKTLWGFVGPRYQNEKLMEFLDEFFGSAKISQALIPVLLTGYDLDTERGVEFFSLDAQKHPSDLDCLMKEVAMASSAAPTYFSPAKISFSWGTMENVIDGAIYAYNPALIAYAQARKTFGHEKTIEVYSIGTGRRLVEEGYQPFKSRGKIKWAAPISGHLLNASIAATTATLNKLLNTRHKKNYFRLDLSNVWALGDLDDVDPVAMKGLATASESIAASNELRRIIDNLRRG